MYGEGDARGLGPWGAVVPMSPVTNDTTENITFAQLRWREVNILAFKGKSNQISFDTDETIGVILSQYYVITMPYWQ